MVDLEGEPLAFETGAVKHQLLVGGGWRYKGMRFGYFAGGYDRLYVENHFKAFANEQRRSPGLGGGVAARRRPPARHRPVADHLAARGAAVPRPRQDEHPGDGRQRVRAPSGIESYMAFDSAPPRSTAFVTDYGNRQPSPERITTLGWRPRRVDLLPPGRPRRVLQPGDRSVGLRDVTVGVNPFDPRDVGIEIGDTGWVNLDPTYTGVGVEADLELFPVDGVDLFANAAVSQVLECVFAGRRPRAGRLVLHGAAQPGRQPLHALPGRRVGLGAVAVAADLAAADLRSRHPAARGDGLAAAGALDGERAIAARPLADQDPGACPRGVEPRRPAGRPAPGVPRRAAARRPSSGR
ncbi:MAG: hypothetical protein R3F59_00215 [Myxococcota bacterium]